MTIANSGRRINDSRPVDAARRHAHVALASLLPAAVVGSLLFILRRRIAWLQLIPAIPFGTALTHWLVPFLIVLLVERVPRGSGCAALGLTIRRESVGAYAGLAVLCLVLPAFIVGVDRTLLLEFVEQMVYIGVAEEVFFRGYLTARLCRWLGDLRGLLISGLVFGLAHIVSRVSQHGLAYPRHDALLGVQTFFGGVLFGLIYLRARSIVPGAILHVATNAYLGRIMEMVSW